jgi:anti-sigma factor RsiW
MCPDRQILSVYLDNELPSPWKEKMEVHISSCAECRKILNRYQALSILSHSEEDFSVSNIDAALDRTQEQAKDRVWEQLSVLNFGEKKIVSHNWNRSFSLPVPFAVAAALVIAFTAAFIGNTLSRPVQNLNTVAALDAQNVIPSADLARIIQYLDAQEDASSMMIINLPETEDFASSGEPALIRAADYSRREKFR